MASCGRTAVFFFQAEDGIRDLTVTGVQTCALPISELAGAGGVEEKVKAVDLFPEFGGDLVADHAGVLAGLADRGDDGVGVLRGEDRSEEGRVGEEGRTRGVPDHLKKKRRNVEM